MPRIVHYDNIETYNQETASIGANLFVVEGTNDRDAKLPGGADVGKGLGVTMFAGDATAGSPISVITHGFAEVFVKAAGTNIARGDELSIHGTTGMLKKAAPASGVNTWVYAIANEAA